jgi:predicted amidohydrolase YtcJ
MDRLDRRTFIWAGLLGATALTTAGRAPAQTGSLQDVGRLATSAPRATVYTAREIITLDPARPTAEAVAVVGDRILWVGPLDEAIAVLGDQPFEIDKTFADHVIVPGFVAQHDHPVLAALTMSSEILSIEDWVLPSGTVAAVKDKQDFMNRLSAAVAARTDPDEPVVTWGYHPAFFGPLTGADLDAISTITPIIVWARSCHEMIFNTAAMHRAKITAELVAGFSDTAKRQSKVPEQRFWEQGLFAVMPYAAPLVATPERMRAGLELTRDFMHAKGVTFGNEPGGILAKPVQDGVNAVFSSPDMPFRWSFMPDGKSLVGMYSDDAQVIAETEKLASWYGGMTSMTSKQVKLFADGAIYSQLMQVREPYLDGHEGEWMMDDDLFQRAFRIYWDAGYQLHIHVNGDAGLDRVLDALETNLRRSPRFGHRTALVHFAVSSPDQVARIKALGAIVSGNPYYVTALADQYGKVGLGPKRGRNGALGRPQPGGYPMVAPLRHADGAGRPVVPHVVRGEPSDGLGPRCGAGAEGNGPGCAARRYHRSRLFAEARGRNRDDRVREAGKLHHPRCKPADRGPDGNPQHRRVGHGHGRALASGREDRAEGLSRSAQRTCGARVRRSDAPACAQGGSWSALISPGG